MNTIYILSEHGATRKSEGTNNDTRWFISREAGLKFMAEHGATRKSEGFKKIRGEDMWETKYFWWTLRMERITP